MSIRSLLLCCILLFPCIASASTLSIQPSVSTLDISYRQNSFIAYRLSAFTQPFDTKIKLKGIQYKTEDSSHSVGLLLNIFPFENAFRISAGAYYFKLDTALSTSVDAINPIYEELINQTSGKATWERLAPYIGLIWGKLVSLSSFRMSPSPSVTLGEYKQRKTILKTKYINTLGTLFYHLDSHIVFNIVKL